MLNRGVTKRTTSPQLCLSGHRMKTQSQILEYTVK